MPFGDSDKITRKVETLASRLRELIASQPPKQLLAYLCCRLLTNSLCEPPPHQEQVVTAPHNSNLPQFGIDDAQFLLEYVHAVLATTLLRNGTVLDERVCTEIAITAEELKSNSMLLAMAIAVQFSEAQLGPETKDLMFRALSNWILLRGNRYQVLEEEFFQYTLKPHDTALRRVYGTGANEIAEGLQSLADSIRLGHMRAIETIQKSMTDVQVFLHNRGISRQEGIIEWRSHRPEQLQAAMNASKDIFEGGICCVSRHTSLPPLLLDDLSFAPGEEKEFFAPGRFSGTPLRTLPARKKPLIKIEGDHYLTDPSFARDSAYRAILFNLLQHEPGYFDEFKTRQKEMSEGAFSSIFSEQLQGAKVYNEVWYRKSGNWFENDTLVLLDDVLILIEAKAGAAATIASPAADFNRHAQSVQDLIVKAYQQCRRFLEYLESAEQAVLYKREDGRYVENLRIHLGDYRVILPFGLTVESFSPFSTVSKQLPGIDPILDKYPFISVSIDDLFLLRRFLPMTGQLMHYLEVRQKAAGIRNAFLYDEIDHLGAYISRNLFTEDLNEQLDAGADMVLYDGMSEIVDKYFSEVDWTKRTPPSQYFPDELNALFCTLDRTRLDGWLAVDSLLRNYCAESRAQLAETLTSLRETLSIHPHRYMLFNGQPSLFFWLYRCELEPDKKIVIRKAQSAALAIEAVSVIVVMVAIGLQGEYVSTSHYSVTTPKTVDETLRTEVCELRARIITLPEKREN
jgi:hypothetical protein